MNFRYEFTCGYNYGNPDSEAIFAEIRTHRRIRDLKEAVRELHLLPKGFNRYFENDAFIVTFPDILTVRITDKETGKTYGGSGCFAVEAQTACFWSSAPDKAIEEVFRVLSRPIKEEL